MKKIVALVAVLAVMPSAANSYNQVQRDKSAIDFSYQQMGVKMDGTFRNFTAQLNFDTDSLDVAQANFDVELASVDAGSGDADQEVAAKAWFNTKDFPTARFVSDRITDTGNGRYAVVGKLTIKGQTRNLTIPAHLVSQSTIGVFEGSFTLHRGDFAIGEGSWSTFDIIANDVSVKFRITATTQSLHPVIQPHTP